MKNIILILSVLCTGLLTTSCAVEGCTDPKAKNFSYEASKDDGSCDYSGCTDPNSLSYDKDAKVDDGSCTYPGGIHFITTQSAIKANNEFLALKVGGEFIGNLQQTCTAQFPTCETLCAHLKFTEKESGSYSLQYWHIKQLSSTKFDTISESIPTGFTVTGNACNIYIIE
jgi:hypothetical protein